MTQVMDDVVIGAEKNILSSFMGSTSIRHIAETVDQSRASVHKIIQKVLCYYSYKISVQQLLPDDING